MLIRLMVLAAAVGGFAWFSLGQESSAESLLERTVDLVDGRPARSILILGNSRTFYNEMPAMLRKVADSADSPSKLQIETHARPAFTFEDHWSDARAQRLLDEEWDEVIIQGESGAQSNRAQSRSFRAYGARLAQRANVRSGRPTLVVNWPYERSVFAGLAGYDRAEHLAFLRETHAKLAREGALERINLAGLWESVQLNNPALRLTSDGNHPTVAGTYLYALAVYRHLAGGPVAGVTHVPDGLGADDARRLREAVDGFGELSL